MKTTIVVMHHVQSLCCWSDILRIFNSETIMILKMLIWQTFTEYFTIYNIKQNDFYYIWIC